MSDNTDQRDDKIQKREKLINRANDLYARVNQGDTSLLPTFKSTLWEIMASSSDIAHEAIKSGAPGDSMAMINGIVAATSPTVLHGVDESTSPIFTGEDDE